MAVKELDKKLNALAKPVSEKITDEAKWRRVNKEWLSKSFDIALGVLSAMKAKGWNQKKLAAEMNVSTQQVSKIVKGKENFTLQTIAKLERVLNVNLIQTSLGPDIQLVPKSVFHESKTIVSNSRITKVFIGKTQRLSPEGKLKNESEWTPKEVRTLRHVA